jgi:hypothetical protein
MKAARSILGALAVATATCAFAADEGSGRRASPADKPSWEFAVTAYPTNVRGGENYTSAIAVADRGPLHLEAATTTSRSARARHSSAGPFPAARPLPGS